MRPKKRMSVGDFPVKVFDGRTRAAKERRDQRVIDYGRCALPRSRSLGNARHNGYTHTKLIEFIENLRDSVSANVGNWEGERVGGSEFSQITEQSEKLRISN